MPTDQPIRPDVEIIRRVLDGDVNAFEGLLQRYQTYVTSIVRKHVPFDQLAEVAHDVFVRVYQALPTCQQPDRFKPWLASIAVRTCYDFWRKRYRAREVPVSTLSTDQQQWLEGVLAGQSAQNFAEEVELQQTRELLEWALSHLSAEDRMVVELVYLEGLSGKETAQLLGWSVTNVKVRSFRARKTLEKLLKKNFPYR